MKRALLNPHGWEVIEGQAEELTVPVGRESLVLHQGEAMPAEISKTPKVALSGSVHKSFSRDGSECQELCSILTEFTNLYVDVIHIKNGSECRM